MGRETEWKGLADHQTTKPIGAPNSVARYLSEGSFGDNKFIVLERINGELRMIAGQTTIEGARRYMLPGRELVDVDNCHILHECEIAGNRTIKSFCIDLDGSLKAELFTEPTSNPITAASFGDETWCTWDRTEPESVRRFLGEKEARHYFTACMLHGTNGFGNAAHDTLTGAVEIENR